MNSTYRPYVVAALVVAVLAGLAWWAVARSGADDDVVMSLPLPALTDLTWEVADDAEIVEVAADSITVRYVPLGPDGEDSDDNDFGSVSADVPSDVVAGILAEGFEFQLLCKHEPTAVSVRVCRTGLYTDAGSPPAWGTYSGGPAPERGPEVCRAVPAGSELQLTVYAYPAAPSTYSDFQLRPASESSSCPER